MNIVVHKSPVLLAFKIVLLEVLAELLYLTVAGTAQVVSEQSGYNIRLISPLTQLILLPIQIGILVYMLLKWSNETYEIQDEELVMRSGVLNQVEKSFPYRNMQSVIVRQTIVERIVGAGTVSVFVPTLGTDLIFTEVPNPKAFADSIKKAIPESENSQFIMRK